MIQAAEGVSFDIPHHPRTVVRGLFYSRKSWYFHHNMLTDAEVNHIATLARIELTDEMRERMKKDLTKVLDYIRLLEEVDTSGVEPLYQVTGLQNQTRPDEHRGDFVVDDVLLERLVGQAPAHQGRLVKVKGIKAKS